MNKFINLIEEHEVALDAGDYKIVIDQKIVIPSKGVNETYTKVQEFAVLGERFSLMPDRIHSVFPPLGSRGEYSKALPHIILNRSTLPWERSADGSGKGTWLALLVFWGNEPPKIKNISVAQLKSTNDAIFPNINDESGDIDTDMITVIDVKKSELETILPQREDLDWMAHARREADENQNPVGAERAVILANRLPKAGAMNTVHLVALENRYTEEQAGDLPNRFDFQGAEADDLIRLVSLKSWSFTCLDEKFSFTGLFKHLNRTPGTLQKPFLNDQVIDLKINAQPATTATTQDNSNNNFTAIGESTFSNDEDEILKYEGFEFLEIEKEFTTDRDEFADLDPFPDHQVFSVFLKYQPQNPIVDDPAVEEIFEPIFGKEKQNATHEKYRKPSLWISNKGRLVYEVVSSEGVRYSELIDDFFENTNAVSITWIKKGLHFYFYKNENLIAKTNAPGSVYSRDSIYWIARNGLTQFTTFRRAISQKEIQILHNNISPNSKLTNYLEKGFTAFPHHFRKSQSGVSWYRSPLTPALEDNGLESKFQFPAVAADELVLHDRTTQMFDVSYAAAWELGKMMALKDQKFALNLYNWKRHNAQQNAIESNHLPFAVKDETERIENLKKEIEAWLDERQLMQGIPFHYLVPEESYLPKESIRFFQLNKTWFQCLKDGAFSLGRATNTDFDRDKNNNDPTNGEIKTRTGFLMRSELVAGFPDVMIQGYNNILANDENPANSTHLEMVAGYPKKFSDEIMICLFEGEVQSVDFFKKPETLHFGIDGQDGEFSKGLRNADGSDKISGDEIDSYQLTDEDWRDQDLKIFHVENLAQHLFSAADFSGENTSVDFTLQMFEGVEKIRFKKKS